MKMNNVITKQDQIILDLLSIGTEDGRGLGNLFKADKTMSYKITKVPKTLFNNSRKRRVTFPITELKVGQMFEAPENQRMSIYNAIKHRRNYTQEIKGRKFAVKDPGNKKVVCIRLK